MAWIGGAADVGSYPNILFYKGVVSIRAALRHITRVNDDKQKYTFKFTQYSGSENNRAINKSWIFFCYAVSSN